MLFADVAQFRQRRIESERLLRSPGGSVVERVLGKDEVAGSIPALGSPS